MWESSQSAEADWRPRFPCKREGPRHFRSYAYNPVFKDRAELNSPEGAFSTRVLQLGKLAPQGALLRSAGGRRLTLPSSFRQPLYSSLSPAPAWLRLTSWHHGGPCCPGSVLREPSSRRSGLLLQGRGNRQLLLFFLPSLWRGRRLLGFSRRSAARRRRFVERARFISPGSGSVKRFHGWLENRCRRRSSARRRPSPK